MDEWLFLSGALVATFCVMWAIGSYATKYDESDLIRWPWWKFRPFRMFAWGEEENEERDRLWHRQLNEARAKGIIPPPPPLRVWIR